MTRLPRCWYYIRRHFVRVGDDRLELNESCRSEERTSIDGDSRSGLQSFDKNKYRVVEPSNEPVVRGRSISLSL
jgi:hypothetical protein